VGYGGTERVISLLADGLVERGHEVTLFAAAGSSTKADLVAPLATPPPCINGSRDDEMYHSLVALDRAHEFDIVHDHTAVGPVLAAMRTTGPPVVHTLHGRWTPGVRRTLGAITERIHLVAISQAQRLANPGVRYAGVVHNGIDLDAHPLRRDKEDFCIFVGRINPEKGPETAVDVARAAGLPLVMIVKREEPDEWAYWTQVVEPRLRPDVTVLEQPPHAVKVDLLGRARVALCPITWPEPFGLVFAEAAACGTPVITRPLGAAPEIVVDGVTGFLRSGVHDMADAVDAARDLSPERCREVAASFFSTDAMVSGYERVYARVCESASVCDSSAQSSSSSRPLSSSSLSARSLSAGPGPWPRPELARSSRLPVPSNDVDTSSSIAVASAPIRESSSPS
jgi:glycosyltransferase involved in cell wall biosynthesis